MTTTSTSLRVRQLQRTRDDILIAVASVLSEDADGGALIERISAEAGTSRATLYAHFPGGLDELVGSAYERIGAEFVRHVAELRDGETGWIARMSVHADVMVALARDQRAGRFYNVTAQRFPSVASVSGTGSRATFDDFVRELSAAREAAQVASIDIVETAHLLTAAIRDIGVRTSLDPTVGEAARTAFVRLAERLGRTPDDVPLSRTAHTS